MKMNKKFLIPAALLVLIGILIIGFSTKDNSGDETVDTDSGNVRSITFTVPSYCRVDENNLRLFNEALAGDGYAYELNINRLDYNEYNELVCEALENGNTDIAFLGLGSEDGENNVYETINSGAVSELDDLLSSDAGAALYSSFPANLWESVKCNGHIYSIPQTLADDYGIYAAFNTDYVDDEDIADWDGGIDGLYEILRNLEWDNGMETNEEGEAVYNPCFIYLLNGYTFCEMTDCEVNYGLLYDYGNAEIVNPLESEKFIHYLSVLDEMKKEYIMSDSIDYMENAEYTDSRTSKNMESGNFAVALDSGETEDAFLKDNIVIKTLTPHLSSRINGSIGISSKAEDIEAVAEFLGILYGDEKYGNILLYGQEGEDYQVIDGYACNMDGTDFDDNYLTELGLNLFINIYPVRGERFSGNRKKEFFSFYENVELSPFIGFQPDTENFKDVSINLDDFMQSLTDQTTDEAVSTAREKLKADGMDEYLASVRNQWEEYSQ